MSVVADTLERVGGYVDEHELRYQLHKHHGLALSADELANQCRILELAGRVEVRVSYRSVSDEGAER